MTTWRVRATGAHRGEIAVLAGVVLLVVLLTGCTASPNATAGLAPSDAGFWLGVWQGLIAPVAFVVSLFNHSVGIYEAHNNGGWYDFGFLIGLSIFFSGSGAGATGRSRASSGHADGARHRR